MQLESDINHILSLAITEDLGEKGDITTNTCVPADLMIQGTFLIKQKGLIAGLALLEPLFQKIDPQITVKLLVKEGSFQLAGASVAEVSGPARGIMTGERCALNLLQHLSGIASTTAEYVKKVAGHPCAILDTRKTLPGLRALEKYAVRMGGGHNHRFTLDDRFIIKGNHLACMGLPISKAIPAAVEMAKKAYPNSVIEIEVSREELFDVALNTAVDAIVLLGMSPDDVTEFAQKGHGAGKKIYVESSVPMTPDTALAYAEAGVDGIAIGAITSSIQALDIGFRLSMQKLDSNEGQVKAKKGLLSRFFSKRH